MDSPIGCMVPKFTCAVVLFLYATDGSANLPEQALATAKKATTFLTDQISTEGGYLWRYSSDLNLREGEGVVKSQTIWVQPPGTPTVGEAFLQLYDATQDAQFLQAARGAGEALRRGQMRSGGWQAMIEFEPRRRKKWAYRTDEIHPQAKDQSSLDDDKTQSALRFVIRLDRALEFKDKAVHEMAVYALNGLLNKGQLPNGGFPQVWTDERNVAANHPQKPANYPASWSHAYQGHQEYWYRYTLNDNLAPDVIRTLLLAEEVYKDARYRAAALKLADFLLLAQMPDPQPAWAQQYNFDMQPIWARKFEPPAITGGESQGVIETLLFVYSRTGNRKYIETIPKALSYLNKSKLPNGRLARFYELKTNRPLYFTRNYELTNDDADVPTHYSFKVANRLDRLQTEYERLAKIPLDRLRKKKSSSQTTHVNETRIREIINALDERGAWVTNDGLRYHKVSGPIIDMRTTVTHMQLLASYLVNATRR